MSDIQMRDSDPGRLLMQDEDEDGDFMEDDNLSAMERLEKSVGSDQCFIRQTAVRNLANVLQRSEVSVDDAGPVFRSVVRLSDDPECAVRIELTKQLFHIARCCNRRGDQYLVVIAGCLLPTVIKLLSDCNGEVRNKTHSVLSKMIKTHCVQRGDIDTQVIPAVKHLLDTDNPDDFRAEAIPLMIELASICGPELVEDLFLPRFDRMCTDPLFQVRKACAVNFGKMCQTVTQETVETNLIPKFAHLCDDGVWGVRKACAECFPQVAPLCSAETRSTTLIQLFLSLVNDQSRWVRMAAFQALGGFIASFANPEMSGLKVTPDGDLETVPITVTAEQRAERHSHDCDGEIIPCNRNQLVMKDSSPDSPPPSLFDMQDSSDRPAAMAAADNPSTESCNDTVADDPDKPSIPEDVVSVEGSLSDLCQQSSTETPSAKTVSVKPDTSSLDVVGPNAEPMVTDVEVTLRHTNGIEKNENAITAEDVQVQSETCTTSENWESDTSEAILNGSINMETSNNVVEKTVNDCNTSVISTSDSDCDKDDDNVTGVYLESETGQDSKTDQQTMSMDVSETNAELASGHIDFIDARSAVPPNAKTIETAKCFSMVEGYDVTKDGMKFDGSAGDASKMAEIESVGCNEDKPDSVSGIHVHTACLSEMSAPSEETVAHIGSTHVHVADELSIVDGIVRPVDDVVKVDVTRRPVTLTLKDNMSVETEYNYDALDVNASQQTTPEYQVDNVLPPRHQFLKKKTGLMRFSMLASRNPEVETMVIDMQPTVQTSEHHLNQSIIPDILLDHYVSMTEPSRAQTVDSEIAYHCAYSLPAVAYTLGRRNWPYLSNLFQTLARDMQWKVRRTLAFSLHQLAVIVGEEVTRTELLPVFDELIHDVDEVRTAVVQHLARFLQLLSPELRSEFLPKIPELVSIDNVRNWRYRQEIAMQLTLLFDIYDMANIYQYILPLLLNDLAKDRVVQVRHSAVEALSYLFWRLLDTNEDKRLNDLIGDFIKLFAQSTCWSDRQLFITLCDCIISHTVIAEACSTTRHSVITMLDHLMPTLLGLHDDGVPNVRIALARCIAVHFVYSPRFTEDELSAHCNSLQNAISALRTDKDKDVRYIMDHAPRSASTPTSDDSDTVMD